MEVALGEVACQSTSVSCPELGDCCQSNGTPGCEDPQCTEAVCDLRAECCTEGWTGPCAFEAPMLAPCRGVGSCPASVCGDGFADPTEVCDGADLQGQGCTAQGFDGGTLACLGDCSGFDTSGCAGFSGACCQAHVSPGCDDDECTAAVCATNPFCCNGFWDNLCVVAAMATPECFGTGVPCPGAVCGDGVAQAGEACDNGDLRGEDCITQGFDGGQIGCLDNCSDFDETACGIFGGDCCSANGTPGCQDPTCTATVCAALPHCCDVAWDEACQAFASTALLCQGVGMDDCPPTVCGNGVVQQGEECDGGDLDGQSCATLGMGFGPLQCDANCEFDTSSCPDFGGDCCVAHVAPGCTGGACTAAVCGILPYCCDVTWDAACVAEAMNQPLACHGVGPSCPGVSCGNGQVQSGELCEASDLNGETCGTQGFGGGTLSCNAMCNGFVTTGCHTGDCCASHGGPGCGNFECESAVCFDHPSCCTLWDNSCVVAATNEPLCQGVGTCPAVECGNGVIQEGETCDGAQVGGEDCLSLGFVGGNLECQDDCSGVDTDTCWSGDCCMANGTAGCDDEECTEAVCALDPYCCNETWDAICGDEAIVEPDCHDDGDDVSSCPSPVCGDGFAEGSEVCDGADLQGETCISQGFGGGALACDGSCEEWDESACFMGDCCSPHGGPGCQDAECAAAVCALGAAGALCCTGTWNQWCAEAAQTIPECVGVGGSCPLI
ncbi:hypothetical protein [Paraliomyxa miuraensis]|uniref:hypothetical protein n=1 Tax=Paraliomyxa miuraensis TaxID=376150 RepID=UPI00224DE61A|nr:hypothetical protein [Paraliomyxa miuraensis]MCX4241760.1 hypothetical protein [Paraliomyxa miuraensis]